MQVKEKKILQFFTVISFLTVMRLGMKKSNFVLLQLCQWRMNLDPTMRQDNFISGALSFSVSRALGTDGAHALAHFNPSTLQGRKNEQLNHRGTKQIHASKSNQRQSWTEKSPGLTFLLSSISCSNMALNTGERAGEKKWENINGREGVMAVKHSQV